MSNTSQTKMNFCLPVNLDRLQNDRLRLIPIEDCTDANLDRLQNDRLRLIPIEDCTDANLSEYITETCINSPELWRFFPIGPHDSVATYKKWYDQTIRHNTATTIFAIYLKVGNVTKRKAGSDETETTEVPDNTFAGTIGLINASADQSTVEIGHVMLLPRFHRTFVNSVANCLLLKHLLDPVSQGDLQMRRVQWQAYSKNTPSIAAAQRLGFSLEGIIRWQRVISDNKECVSGFPGEKSQGKPVVDAEGRELGPGRHSALLAMCWDDWLDGTREHVLGLLARA